MIENRTARKKGVILVVIFILACIVIVIFWTNRFGKQNVSLVDTNAAKEYSLKEEIKSNLEKAINFEEGYYLDIANKRTFKFRGYEYIRYEHVHEDENYLYFCSLFSIYRCKKDGTDIDKLYTRERSGMHMEIKEVNTTEIVYIVFSEDGESLKKLSK